ncbi:MAG: sulfur carrier protein ThiS [Candidatus Margulisbacteria bacterium]|nr:sulfur carrier protein ThiS [Candidatus Margulisiibacteriota bacterium]
MKIRINGEDAEVNPGLLLIDLLQKRQINPAAVIIEHNHQIISCSQFPNTPIQENDRLEIISFVGGG